MKHTGSACTRKIGFFLFSKGKILSIILCFFSPDSLRIFKIYFHIVNRGIYTVSCWSIILIIVTRSLGTASLVITGSFARAIRTQQTWREKKNRNKPTVDNALEKVTQTNVVLPQVQRPQNASARNYDDISIHKYII